MEHWSVPARTFEDIGERRPAMAARALSGAAEDLTSPLGGLAIETARGGGGSLQALLVIEQCAQLRRDQVGRLLDRQADAWIEKLPWPPICPTPT